MGIEIIEQNKKINHKLIKLDEETHYKLKLYAVKNKITLNEAINKLLNKNGNR